jgi:hypothetical protein
LGGRRHYGELFKFAGREKELHREFVALAISHDDESVRLTPIILLSMGIRSLFGVAQSIGITSTPKQNGRLGHSRKMSDTFSTMHLERIRSAIDHIPPGMTLLSQESESQSSEHPP